MTTAADFDKKYDIIDAGTPRHQHLSGRYKQSFAYQTIRERLPVTITSIIDNMTQNKDELVNKYGEDSREELKTVIGKLSKLKYELQTDKLLKKFTGEEPDKDVWNDFIAELKERSYFKVCWLYAECYIYRRVYSFFEATNTLKNFDYFKKQKMEALISSAPAMEAISLKIFALAKSEEVFREFLKLNLWGNRCDLSITSNENVLPLQNFFDTINSLDTNILIDHSVAIWNCLADAANKKSSQPIIVDIICDNAGFELFTDFVIADYIIDKNLATIVRFNVKAIPWFVSDATAEDFHWTLKWLSENKSSNLSEFGKRWNKHLGQGKFELMPVEYFWTSPVEYYKMRDLKPELYERLSKSELVIFKGDLNYRKLLGDVNWDDTEEFITCIRGFTPTNFCTLRTLKADLICGLGEGVADKLYRRQSNWMLTGDYGIIQYSEKIDCGCKSLVEQ